MGYVLDDEVQFWRTRDHIRIASGIINAEGVDGRPVLRTEDGRYVAVSAGSQPLLRLLEHGVPGQDLFAMVEVDESDRPTADRSLAKFLNDLRSKSLLNIPSDHAASSRERFLGLAKREFFIKLFKSRRLAAALSSLGHSLQKLPVASVTSALVIVPVAGLLLTGLLAFPRVSVPTFPVVLTAGAILVLHLCIHESGHAVAMGYNGLVARDMGLGLAWYVLPVAFVDRGETYTLKSRRGRAGIALAGPLCDATLSGTAAILGTILPGRIGETFTLAAVLQLYLLAANLNPLFRSDGYHVIEALVGATNIRGRALTFVLSHVMRLPMPRYVNETSTPVKIGYVIYLFSGFLYFTAFGWMVFIGLGTLAGLR